MVERTSFQSVKLAQSVLHAELKARVIHIPQRIVKNVKRTQNERNYEVHCVKVCQYLF